MFLFLFFFLLTVGCFVSVSLKRPAAPIKEVEAIELVRAKIAEEDRFFKELLYFRNLYKAGLIGKAEHDRRVREEEEEEARQSKRCRSACITCLFLNCRFHTDFGVLQWQVGAR